MEQQGHNGAIPLSEDMILAMMAPEIVKQMIEDAKEAEQLSDLDRQVEMLTRRIGSMIQGEKTTVTICVLWTLMKHLILQNLPEAKNNAAS